MMKLKKILALIMGWLLWILSTLVYSHQYFLRVSIGGISEYLIQIFNFTLVDLANLSAGFFLTYVLFMPCAGVLLDRYGVKKILSLTAVVSGLSSLGFAHSNSSEQLFIFRLIMGAAASFSLTSVFLIIRFYFKNNLFPLLSGLTLTIGILGGTLGEGPFYALSQYIGWQMIMDFSGAFVIFIGVLLYILLGNDNSKTRDELNFKQLFENLKNFINRFQNWLPGIYGGLMLSPIIAFASFWGAPFLSAHYDISHALGKDLVTIIFIGYALGSPLIALLAQKYGIQLVMIMTAIVSVFSTFCIVHFAWPLIIVALLLFLQGITVSSFVLTPMAIKKITDIEILASALSFSTMIAQLFGAGILWLIGEIIYYDSHGLIFQKKQYSLIIMQQSMYVLVGFLCLAIMIALLVRLPKNDNIS